MIKKNLISVLLIFFSMFSISRCYAEVSVGDYYGGGTVFCVSQTPDITQCVTEGSGDYGLIMANEDQANFDFNPEHGVPWSSVYDAISAARSYDDGLGNTRAIIAALPGDNPGNNAAWLCHSYNDLGGSADSKLTDWYLPAKNELDKMYLYGKANNLIGKGCVGNKPDGVQCLVGGYEEGYNIYWSSSEYSGNDDHAWSRFFSLGFQHYDDKVGSYFGVRAVRAFNNLTIKQFNNLFFKNLKLGYLEFTEGKITTDIAEEIASYVSGFKPSKITISNVDISDEALQIILDALQAKEALTTLDLSKNNIGFGKINIIANWLHRNKTLVTLNLSNNKIGDREIEAMAFALMNHKSLTALDLSNNQITDVGAESIIEILKTNKTLTNIEFSPTDIGKDSKKISLQNAATILNLLKKNLVELAAKQAKSVICMCDCAEETWLGTIRHSIGTLPSITKCSEICKNIGNNWKMNSCDKIANLENFETEEDL